MAQSANNTTNHGTLFKPFSPYTIYDSDPNLQCLSQCITAMPYYENKSLEELRYEDYKAAKELEIPVADLNSILFQSKECLNNKLSETEEELPERQALVSMLECPVCYETCCPPIYTCRAGHSICKNCKPKIKNVCPMCRKGYYGTRNFIAEELFEALKITVPELPPPTPSTSRIRSRSTETPSRSWSTSISNMFNNPSNISSTATPIISPQVTWNTTPQPFIPGFTNHVPNFSVGQPNELASGQPSRSAGVNILRPARLTIPNLTTMTNNFTQPASSPPRTFGQFDHPRTCPGILPNNTGTSTFSSRFSAGTSNNTEISLSRTTSATTAPLSEIITSEVRAHPANDVPLVTSGIDVQPQGGSGNANVGHTHLAGLASPSSALTSGVTLTDSQYYCIPPIPALDRMVNLYGQCLVSNFEIGHAEYGKIVFLGQLNIAGLDICRTVKFSHQVVNFSSVGCTNTPSGLLHPAEVTLYKMAAHQLETLKTRCEQMRAQFIGFDPHAGTWTFKIPKF